MFGVHSRGGATGALSSRSYRIQSKFYGVMVLGALSIIPPTLLLLNQQRQSCRATVEYTPLLGATETGSNTDTDDTPPQNQPTLNPFIVYFLEALFFLLMGQEIAFSSWISSYVVESGISNSNANAVCMSSAFCAAMLTGRLLIGWSASLVQVKNSTLLKSSINFQFLSSTFLLVFCLTWRSYKTHMALCLNEKILRIFRGGGLLQWFNRYSMYCGLLDVVC
jgi:hypothetical protein